MTPGTGYDAARAAAYWSGARHESGDEMAAVLSLGEPPHVNAAYDAWEAGLLLDALARAAAGGRALDLGAGVGRVSIRLAPRFGRLVSGDLAPGMLDRLRRNAARAGAGNIDPVRLRSDRLPFRDGAFDAAVCVGLLEHVPPPVRRATLAELARVIRKGGGLLLVLNNDQSALLQDPGDNPHRVGAQRENGYYCAVVHGGELLSEAAADFEDEALGSNLFYSLHRHASRALDDRARRDPRLAAFFERAAAWDRALRPLGAMADGAADHHLHLLVRR
ncbi:MAG: class I SAM-dependent methyltransferase [Bacteroidota bacterium]